MVVSVGRGLSTLHISPFQEKASSSALADYYERHRALLSRAELDYMSMADGRPRGLGGKYEFEQEPATLEIAVGGSLVTARPQMPKRSEDGAGGVGGVRGAVVGFSSASRRRLMRMIAAMERAERPHFVTLTYPDEFPKGVEKWKRDMDTFGKRLRRKMPGAGFIWRIEFKVRKSGASMGEIAPHFHLLVYGASYRDLREFVGGAWYRVVGSGDEDHEKAGVRTERIYSYGGIMRYVGKYLSKVEEFPPGWVGRVWGVVGRKNLPWALIITIPLTEREGILLVRLGRKMIGLRGKTLINGLTWIANSERIMDYLEFLQGFT